MAVWSLNRLTAYRRARWDRRKPTIPPRSAGVQTCQTPRSIPAAIPRRLPRERGTTPQARARLRLAPVDRPDSPGRIKRDRPVSGGSWFARDLVRLDALARLWPLSSPTADPLSICGSPRQSIWEGLKFQPCAGKLRGCHGRICPKRHCPW